MGANAGRRVMDLPGVCAVVVASFVGLVCGFGW